MDKLIFAISDTGSIAVATIIAAGIASAPAVISMAFTRRTNRTIRPGGDFHNLLTSTNVLLQAIVRIEAYTRRRNHDILNGQYRMMLAMAEILRRMGVPDMPDPRPPQAYDHEEELTKIFERTPLVDGEIRERRSFRGDRREGPRRGQGDRRVDD